MIFVSLICSVLHWLQEEEKRILDEVEAASSQRKVTTDDWFADILNDGSQSASSDQSVALGKLSELTKRIEIAKSTVVKYPSRLPSSLASAAGAITTASDMEFLLDDYMSDDEVLAGMIKTTADDDPIDYSGLQLPRIYYCSRTHSQISQFIAEIAKTPYASTRVITLSSRKNYCINDEVSQLSSDATITERCKDMQKHKRTLNNSTKRGKSLTSCPFYTHGTKQQAFVYKSLSEIGDLETLHELGRKHECCPYYATRKASQYAQVVCMSYNMILQKDMREAMNISLTNSVVIFDEGHNLVDAISQMHSHSLSQRYISAIVCMIEVYLDRFLGVLNGKNSTNLQKLLAIMRKMTKINPNPRVMTLNDFTFEIGIDNINITRLMKYIRENRLAEKIGGFAESVLASATAATGSLSTVSTTRLKLATRLVTLIEKGKCIGVIRDAIQFLNSFELKNEDGRISIVATTVDEQDAMTLDYEDGFVLRFILLNPSNSFDHLVRECRSILILGGTMQPFSYAQTMLLPTLSEERLVTFSCGHVVASENVFATIITHDRRTAFNFQHQTRATDVMLTSLHTTLSALMPIIPHGVVVFFSSYKYMQFAVQQWRTWNYKQFVKPLYVEPTSHVQCDMVLNQYTAAAATKAGGCLFCVMGGKLSEGINFSDDLARAVIVVGMPFPDSRDAVLQEKLAFAERMRPGSKQQIYENICMRSVNQSIGRSIRHKDDFASIILIDERYSTPRIQRLLPSWIGQNISVDVFENSINKFGAFFEQMREKYRK